MGHVHLQNTSSIASTGTAKRDGPPAPSALCTGATPKLAARTIPFPGAVSCAGLASTHAEPPPPPPLLQPLAFTAPLPPTPWVALRPAEPVRVVSVPNEFERLSTVAAGGEVAEREAAERVCTEPRRISRSRRKLEPERSMDACGLPAAAIAGLKLSSAMLG